MFTFPNALIEATLIKRYNRFLADVRLPDGTVVTAHCPNTGSMKSCWWPEARVYLSRSDDPKRKLAYTWELIATEGGFIGINTARPNQIIEAAVQAQVIPELTGYKTLRREAKYSHNSRIDLLLSDHPHDPRACYVEVKNTTLFESPGILFPDAVTERGQKHLRDLADMVQQGHRAVMLFFVNRSEGDFFAPADHIDGTYGKLLRQVAAEGVEILAYRALHTKQDIRVGQKIPVNLRGV